MTLDGVRLRRIAALLAVLWAAGHLAWTLVNRDGIHPFTGIGWVREHVVFALVVGLVGAIGLWAAPTRLARLASLALATVCVLIFGRWFLAAPGLLSVAALGTALLAARGWPERVVWAALLVFAGVFVVGGLRQGTSKIGPVSLATACDDAALRLSGWDTDGSLKPAFVVERDAVRPSLRPAYCRLVAENLAAKEMLSRDVVVDLRRRVLGFERFRLETTLSSGVTPKRYFGFLDEAGDTAAYETVLRQTVRQSVTLIELQPGKSVNVTELEVAMTFLAEGGAMLLSERQDDLERIHPVNGIGLDNFRDGFARRRTLVEALDKTLGTELGALTWPVGKREILRRPMTFREAIAGTAVMYYDEKERTARLLHERDGTTLKDLPLDEQFVTASLVYNSGILFSKERVAQILSFSTGDYLAATSEANRATRAPLPVWSPTEAETQLAAGAPLPVQLTSWNAVYHILQRYSTAVAVRKFSDFFNSDGRFTR